MIMNLEDYHVHCEYSDDSDYPMEQVVKDAVAKGLSEICFTDHVDYGIKVDHDQPYEFEGQFNNVDYEHYFPQIAELAQGYGDQITIRTGLEFGMQTHTVPQFEDLYRTWQDQFDFILLSCHQVNNMEFWTGDFQKGRTPLEYTRAYYQEILDVMRLYKDYSVLAHLDMIIRYDQGEHASFEDVKDLITEILKQAIADGKGIEVYTSSVRYQVGDLTPSRQILSLYKDLGGRILTFGSDSHTPGHLGAYLDEQKQILKDLGFTEYCTFEKMKPVFHAL